MGKSNQKQTIFLTVDAEWASNEDYLSFQCFVGKNLYIYYSNKLQNLESFQAKIQSKIREKNWNVKYCMVEISLIPWDFESISSDPNTWIFTHLCQLEEFDSSNDFVIEFFYSLRDLYPLFSKEFLSSFFQKTFDPKHLKNTIAFKRCTYGNFCLSNGFEITLRDYFGLSPSGLVNLFQMAGIDNPDKGLLDDYKACMEKCFETDDLIETFFLYAASDVYYLSMVEEKLVQNMNQIMGKTLQFPSETFFGSIRNRNWSKKQFPRTLGSLSAHFLESFLHTSFQKEGLLEEFLKWNHLLGISLSLDMKKEKEKEELKNKEIWNSRKKKGLVSTLVSGAGIQSVASLHHYSTGLLNILSAGGRAYNERVDEYTVEKVLDVDFQSCYGSALSRFQYPIGLPTIYGRTNQQKSISLRKFLKKYEEELVPDLYTITISGKLSFDQSLLYSKIVNEKALVRKITALYDESDEDAFLDRGDMAGDFVILHEELKNTTITSDTLEILRKVCSNQELHQIMNCRVVTAMFYKKSDSRPYKKSEWTEGKKLFFDEMKKVFKESSFSY